MRLGRLTLVGKVTWIVTVVAIANAGTINFARLVPDVPLAGVEHAAPPPVHTLASIWQGTFQHAAEQWFEQHWGLRGYLVRTDNTLNIAVFDETRIGQHVVLGQNGVLYNHEDIGYLERADPPGPTLEEGKFIARVQKKAMSRGYVVIPVILPSKTSVFRSTYPPARRRRGAFERSDVTIYGALVESLRANGAVFVDLRATLAAEVLKPEDSFSKTARHYRITAACRALQLVLDAARPTIRDFGEEQIDCHSHPEPSIDRVELDLFELLNTWFGPPADMQGVMLDGRRGSERLRLPTLFVGTSFVTPFTAIARKLDVLRPFLYYYYDARVVDERGESHELEPFTPQWRKETFSKRLFVVAILETFSPGDGHKFLDEVDRELDRDPNLRAPD